MCVCAWRTAHIGMSRICASTSCHPARIDALHNAVRPLQSADTVSTTCGPRTCFHVRSSKHIRRVADIVGVVTHTREHGATPDNFVSGLHAGAHGAHTRINAIEREGGARTHRTNT